MDQVPVSATSRFAGRVLSKLELQQAMALHRIDVVRGAIQRTLAAMEKPQRTARKSAAAAAVPQAQPQASASQKEEVARLGEMALDEMPDAFDPRDAAEPLRKRLKLENSLPVCELEPNPQAATPSPSLRKLEREFLDTVRQGHVYALYF